jgi:uncharacterized protein (TIGR00369 family)
MQIWREPVRGSYPEPELFGLTGLEQVTTFLERGGPAPPIGRLIGAEPVHFAPGEATFAMPATGWLSSGLGVVGGGTLAMLTDASLGCAIQTALGPATPYTTAELSMTLLRPIPIDGRVLTARGKLIHAGRSVGLSEVFVEDPEDRLVAHGTSRCHIFAPLDPLPPRPEPLPPVEPDLPPTPDPYARPVEGTDLGADLGGRDGLQTLRDYIAGDLDPPPLHHLTGMLLTEAAEGSATFVMPATEWLASPTRFVQGGAIAMLADIAITCAVESTVPKGGRFVTVDVKVNYLRPVQADGTDLTARGTVVHRGRTLAIANSEVVTADGKRAAMATGSVFLA